MKTMFLMVWWGFYTFPLIEEAEPPVVSTITSWSVKSCMKSADLESFPFSSNRKMEIFYTCCLEN